MVTKDQFYVFLFTRTFCSTKWMKWNKENSVRLIFRNPEIISRQTHRMICTSGISTIESYYYLLSFAVLGKTKNRQKNFYSKCHTGCPELHHASSLSRTIEVHFPAFAHKSHKRKITQIMFISGDFGTKPPTMDACRNQVWTCYKLSTNSFNDFTFARCVTHYFLN